MSSGTLCWAGIGRINRLTTWQWKESSTDIRTDGYKWMRRTRTGNFEVNAVATVPMAYSLFLGVIILPELFSRLTFARLMNHCRWFELHAHRKYELNEIEFRAFLQFDTGICFFMGELLFLSSDPLDINWWPHLLYSRVRGQFRAFFSLVSRGEYGTDYGLNRDPNCQIAAWKDNSFFSNNLSTESAHVVNLFYFGMMLL